MFFLKGIFALVVAFNCSLLHAQAAAPVAPPAAAITPSDDEEVVVVDEKSTREIHKGSSEFNRMSKSFLATAQLYGYGPISGRGVGLSLGKFVERNSVVLFEAIRNNAENEFSSTESIKNSSIGLHFKKFEKNSFYWRMGTDYRATSYSYTAGSSKAFDSESVNFTAALGSEWFWRSLTLGVDWIGASVPLYSKIKNETVTGIYTTTDLDDNKKKYTTETTGIYFRFYVGVAF